MDEPVLEPGMVLIAPHPSESVEILETPRETGDRYRLRLRAPIGGGPGVKGRGVHAHPGFVESFRCVAGSIRVRVGSELGDLSPGQSVEVPPDSLHGFVGIGNQPLVTDVEIVFTPPGPRPQADLVAHWATVDQLIKEGSVSERTGMPPLLQLAALLDRVPEAFRMPGPVGWLMKPVAVVGRLMGY
jgi:mannose-6-phosphate isomerase-like protein (cupin superfamily)